MLSDAQETLQTLTDFESRVQDTEGAARAALATVTNIEDALSAASEQTAAARAALDGAAENAELSLSVAQMAQEVSEAVREAADGITVEAAAARGEARELKDSALDLMDKLEDTDVQLSQKEEEANSDQVSFCLVIASFPKSFSLSTFWFLAMETNRLPVL